MTISISKTSLLNKLQLLSKIISSKPSLPILGNYLFETKEGRLFLTASNSEGRIMTSLECISDEDMSVCVPTAILDGLKTLPEQPLNIYINPNNKEILIKYSGGKFEFMGYETVSYPSKKEFETSDCINTTAEEFYNGIAKVVNLAAEDELRPVMSTVHIEASPKALTFVGTDGHGLGSFSCKKESCINKVSVIISRPMASILKGIVPASPDDLQIKVGTDWSVVTVSDFEISFRNVEGRYPNWKAVIPHNNPLELVVDTKQLIGAIKRTTVFSNKSTCLILFKADYDRLVVSANDLDYSTSAEEILSAEFKDDEFKIGVKGSLILEMLSCIDDERTKLTFSQPNSAILIMPEKQLEGQELTYLLMPMTIQ